MSDREQLLEFPCDYPIKVMGRSDGDFDAHVEALLKPHAPEVSAADMRIRESRNGRFISVTITIRATSSDQLEAISASLRESERVLASV